MKHQFTFLKQEEEQQTINKTTLTKHRKWSPEQSDHFNRTYSQLLALPRQMRRRLQRRFGLSLVGLALTLALSGTPIASIIRAQPVSVPTAGIRVDGTTCTLEEAITSANNDNAGGNGCVDGSGADIITLAADVTLAAALPAITTQITIEGDGYFIDGANSFRVLEVSSASGNLTLNKSTIRNGNAYEGAGILVGSGATLAVNNSTIANNSGSQGCGIQNRGTATITNSTISGNSGTFAGGGIRTSGNTTLINSTITGNHANTSGGGVGFLSGGTLTLERSIIAGNSATNGKEIDNLFNIGTITNNGFNVVGSSAATRAANFRGFTPGANDFDASSDQQNTALASILNTTLADNGGETLTHALVSGSPAIDIASSGPATDQRGYGRPVGSGYDAGAFEYGASAPASPNARINSTDCDLIDAITAANTDSATGDCAAGSAGADTITLLSDVTLTAVNNTTTNGPNGLPVISSEITIEGADFTIARDASAPSFRLFEVAASGDLTLNNTTVSGGNLGLSVSSPFRKGGGLYVNSSGALTLNNSAINNNSAEYGGAIYSKGTVTLTNSVISGNTVTEEGGAIKTYSTLALYNTTVDGNTAGNDAGGIYANGATVTIVDSTISNNQAAKYGGAIYAYSGQVTITNSTISGNTANQTGGGISRWGGTLVMTQSTVSGNTAVIKGGGIRLGRGTATLHKNIIAGNSAPSGAEVFNGVNSGTVGTITANDANLFGHAGLTNAQAFAGNGNFISGANDVNATSDGTTPTALASILNTTLADNGGETLTHALVSGSPAIDEAPSADCSASPIDGLDQRGAARNFDGDSSTSADECDIGAVEFRTVEEACSVGVGSHALGNVTIEVVTGGNIDCLTAEEMNVQHPLAITGIQTDNWFHLKAITSGGGDATDYSLNLTIPDAGFTAPTVCRSVGGESWDCAANSNSGGTVTRNGVTQLSDWAAGNQSVLAVDLASFTALAEANQVRIQWQTVSEQNNLGFNIYRAEVTSDEVPVTWTTQLNPSLIPAQAPGSGQGSAYEFVDEELEAGKSYYYWLEDVDLDGQTSLHGPISATVNEPTAITLEGFTIEMPTISLWGLMAFMLTLLMGGWALRRQ